MKLKDGAHVSILKDEHESGYAGFGHGGVNLYVTYLADCFQPTIYVVRADDLESAYDTAVECLCDTVSDDDIRWEAAHNSPPYDLEFLSANDPEAFYDALDELNLTHSPSGRVIWNPESLMLVDYRITNER